jgi:hypothetical protein
MKTGKDSMYFPHDSNAVNDPKIMLLMAQMGLEAYGIYWILIEYLREQPGYNAPLSLLDPLSRRYGSSKEKFETVVKRYALFDFDENNFCSVSLIKRMQPLEEKRDYMRELAHIRWQKKAENQLNNTSDAYALPPHSAGNAQAMQSKVKESKVKKSKVKESKVKNYTDFVSPSFLPVWEKWIAYKKEIGKPYKTLTGMNGKYNELVEISGDNVDTALEIVKQSINNEWAGFFALKTTKKEIIPGEDMFVRERRLLKEARERRENSQKPNIISNGN